MTDILPFNSVKIPEKVDKILNELEEQNVNIPRVVAKNNNKKYGWDSKKSPDSLSGPLKANEPCYLYKINIELKEEDLLMTKDEVKDLFRFCKYDFHYGLVTLNKLIIASEIKTPLFGITAKFDATLTECGSMSFTEEQFEKMVISQKYIFRELVNLKCEIFDLLQKKDQVNIENIPYLIVPLQKKNEEFEIFYEMSNFANFIDLLVEVNFNIENRKKFIFKPEDYHTAIVSPVYRTLNYAGSLHYCVTSVTDLTPKSPFISVSKAATYDDYYKKAYNIYICNREQFLVNALLVENTKDINFLIDQSGLFALNQNQRCFKNVNKLDQMVTELTYKSQVSSTFYIQGLFLPSIVQRITRFLLAYELKENISTSRSKLGLGSNSSNFEKVEMPKLINLDWSPEAIIDPSFEDIIEALTLPNSFDSFNLKKYKSIGKSFIKYKIALYLMFEFQDLNYSSLAYILRKLSSQSNLTRIGMEIGFQNLLSGSYFYPRASWLPPSETIHPTLQNIATSFGINYNIFDFGVFQRDLVEDSFLSTTEDLLATEEDTDDHTNKHKPKHTTYTHSIVYDRDISHSFMALIGVYLLNGGQSNALRVLNWSGLKVPNKNGEFVPLILQKVQELEKINHDLHPEIKISIEKLIPYKFHYKWLLFESIIYHNGKDKAPSIFQQQLQFLGENVLDLIINSVALEKYSEYKNFEDLLKYFSSHKIRAILCIKMDLYKYFLPFDHVGYLSEWKKINKLISNAISIDIDISDSVYSSEIKLPIYFENIFSTILGAVFLDSAYSFEAVKNVVYDKLINDMENFVKYSKMSALKKLEKFSPIWTELHPDSHPPEKKGKFNTILEMDIKDMRIMGAGRDKNEAKEDAANKLFSILNDANYSLSNYTITLGTYNTDQEDEDSNSKDYEEKLEKDKDEIATETGKIEG